MVPHIISFLTRNLAQGKNTTWWQSQLDDLKSNGFDSIFIPLFQGYKNYISKFANFSAGASDWGSRSYAAANASIGDAAYAHNYVKTW